MIVIAIPDLDLSGAVSGSPMSEARPASEALRRGSGHRGLSGESRR